MRWTVAAVAALGMTWTAQADAAVLCKKKSGVVVVRDEACKKKETALDLAQFGALGPKGDKGEPGIGPLTTCPPDSVAVGPTCVDTYEASVWLFQPSNVDLVAKVRAGNATLADLTAGGAVQLGCTIPPYNQTAPPVYFPRQRPVDARPRLEPAEPWRVRRASIAGRGAERLRHVVSGGAGVRAVREAAADQRGVAARGRGNAGHRESPTTGLTTCNTNSGGRGADRLAQPRASRLGRLRHGGQRRRVDGRLGPGRRRSARAGARSATTS